MKAAFSYLAGCGWVLLFTVGLYGCASFGEQQAGSIDFLNLVTQKRFVFNAQTATPLGGNLIQLNTLYFLRLTPDSVISYLPYFGRAFSAPMNTQDAGLTFNATDFTYVVSGSGTEKREVTIVTNGQRNNYKMYFTIYRNGQAQLQVTSINRQAIYFNGYVTEKPL